MFKRSGFTIVELMVAVAIIVILSTIAFSTYSSTQKAGRDAKRRGDIDAVAIALEANKTSSGYIDMAGSQFTSGNIPNDPNSTGVTVTTVAGCGTDPTDKCWYCLRSSSNYCDPTDTTNFSINADRSTAAYQSSWYVCANLETGSPKYYCRKSQQ